jgi:uncharacterized cupredoxin-like copper-binding protein
MLNATLLIAFVCSLILATASVEDTQWRQYVIPQTGAAVAIPVTIFTEDAGPPDGGVGWRFFTMDRRADLTVQSVLNPENDSPASFLAKKAAASRDPVQKGDATFLRVIQHSQWADLVRPLQLG